MTADEKKISRLERLKQQQAKIAARIQAEEARDKQKKRKEDTRRKILIGSYYLEKAQNENTYEQLKKELATYLKRDTDRALFN